jgi:hypothetical protein
VDKTTDTIALQHGCNYRRAIHRNQAIPQAQDRGVALLIGELREQAERCWRLAKSIYNPAAAADLEVYARQLEECAEQLEAKLVLEPPAVP